MKLKQNHFFCIKKKKEKKKEKRKEKRKKKRKKKKEPNNTIGINHEQPKTKTWLWLLE